MNFSNFILNVLIVYAIYYIINILYDVFIKKHKNVQNADNEKIIDFSNVIQEEVTNVTDYIEPIYTEEKHQENIDKNNTQNSHSENNHSEPVSNNTFNDEIIVDEPSNDDLYLPIEGQGIPFETLLKEGKELFSSVNF